ncbi:SRPBCC family protein [Cyanobium sp. N5-Cardenillas]|uniref:SRPBCC family protein n=1 Tax=Cyanobium sp. N5-Cardenillas TaxID=2823720 RepID=UPI0020CB7B32|nr:SRPBCC family protein [Cyanobium sp. N5-Cardenillas]MCP9785976.1 SRPBCC family protein [Cyanobium sp. N5-Cardenillas]
MILTSITKTVSIQAPVEKVFEFLSNPANWPLWAIVNVKAIRPSDDEWWDMETPTGQAKLRIRPDAATGLLDHDFHAPDASWTVPARVVPNGDGSEVLLTFFQPPSFGDDFFKQQISLVDSELAKLKQIMES